MDGPGGAGAEAEERPGEVFAAASVESGLYFHVTTTVSGVAGLDGSAAEAG